MFFSRHKNWDFFSLTMSFEVCSIYPASQRKSFMVELHKIICRIIFKNMHYHISVLITCTILLNILNAKRKNIKQIILSIALSEKPFAWEWLKGLKGSHLSPLVSFANMLHLEQLRPYLFFNIWLLSVAHRWKVRFLCTMLLWGCNTELSEGILLYLCNFLPAISKEEVARTFHNICLTFM